MNLVLVGDKYVNPDMVIHVDIINDYYSNKNKLAVHLTDGTVAEVFITTKSDIDKIIKRLTTNIATTSASTQEIQGDEAIECAKKIKDYCAERAFARCKSCALYHDGCFVGLAYKNELTDSYIVKSPLDWEV